MHAQHEYRLDVAGAEPRCVRRAHEALSGRITEFAADVGDRCRKLERDG